MTDQLALSNQEAQPSPMQLLSMAVQGGAQIDTIERLAKLQQDMLAQQAERDFNYALHSSQAEVRRIGADRENSQTRSKYATFTKLDAALRPIYNKHGFSLSFDTADGRTIDSMKVIAYLSHIGGHTRTYTIDVPCDGKGAKGNDVMTRTHAAGSGLSYGKRYLEASIFNVTIGDTDDDGNRAGGSDKRMDEGQLLEYMDAIGAADSLETLKNVWEKADSFAVKTGDLKARAELARAKDRRKNGLA